MKCLNFHYPKDYSMFSFKTWRERERKLNFTNLNNNNKKKLPSNKNIRKHEIFRVHEIMEEAVNLLNIEKSSDDGSRQKIHLESRCQELFFARREDDSSVTLVQQPLGLPIETNVHPGHPLPHNDPRQWKTRERLIFSPPVRMYVCSQTKPQTSFNEPLRRRYRIWIQGRGRQRSSNVTPRRSSKSSWIRYITCVLDDNNNTGDPVSHRFSSVPRRTRSRNVSYL